eukprot:7995606-Alexandrium_andersonii.AAC.1
MKTVSVAYGVSVTGSVVVRPRSAKWPSVGTPPSPAAYAPGLLGAARDLARGASGSACRTGAAGWKSHA